MLQESPALQLVLLRPLTRWKEEGQALPPLPLILYAAARTADCWLQPFPLLAANSLNCLYPHSA